MLIFSIDPGIVNIGACLFDTSDNKVIWADKVQLCAKMKDMKTESEIIPRVYKVFFTDKIFEMIQAADIVLIEQQMKKKFFLIQYVLGAICFEKGIDYKFASPRSVKTYFKSGKTSRKKTGTSVRGSNSNHAANKKTAIELATKLFPSFMLRVNVKKRDDVADAILQAKWYCDKYIIKKSKKLVKDVQ